MKKNTVREKYRKNGEVKETSVARNAHGNVLYAAAGKVRPDAAVTADTGLSGTRINGLEQDSVLVGTAEANATVHLRLGTAAHDVAVDSAGNWRYALEAEDIAAMGQGKVVVSATQRDAEGKVSVAGTRSITLDTASISLSAIATGAVLR